MKSEIKKSIISNQTSKNLKSNINESFKIYTIDTINNTKKINKIKLIFKTVPKTFFKFSEND